MINKGIIYYDQFHLWVDNLHDYSEKYRKPGFSQKVIAWNHQYVLCIICMYRFFSIFMFEKAVSQNHQNVSNILYLHSSSVASPLWENIVVKSNIYIISMQQVLGVINIINEKNFPKNKTFTSPMRKFPNKNNVCITNEKKLSEIKRLHPQWENFLKKNKVCITNEAAESSRRRKMKSSNS